MRSVLLTRIGVCLVALTAAATAQSVVISQVYGGGGGGAAVYKNDYVELFNPTSSAVNLNGYSVQYQAAASTGNWSGKVNLSGSIGAGKYFLVVMSNTTGSGASALDLPAADVTFTSSVSMSASAGKVALVSNTTSLATAAGPPVVCPGAAAGVVDLVGYGSTANCSETSPVSGTIDATRVLVRAGAGCTDTGNNSSDFTSTSGSIASPWTVRNSSTAGNTCGGGGTPTASISLNNTSGEQGSTVSLTITGTNTNFVQDTTTVAVSGTGVTAGTVTVASTTSLSTSLTIAAGATAGARTLTVSTGSETATATFTVTAPPPVSRKIYEINGSGASSPLAGVAVTTTGIVTAIRANATSTKAFYIESLTADRDSDSATSEGVQVFIGSAALPACAAVGNQIQISATVTDFVPSTAPSGSVPVTELTSPSSCTVLATNSLASLPAAVTFNSANAIDPAGSATQMRRYLGMRVSIPSATVVGPSTGNGSEANATQTPNGQFFITLPNVTRPLRGTGILATRRPSDAAGTVPTWTGNPEDLRVDITALATATASPYEVTPGQTISNLAGVVDYNTSQGQYQIYTDDTGKGTVSGTALSYTAVPLPNTNEITVASANVERFYNSTSDGNGDVVLTSTGYQGRLNKLSLAIRNVLRFPDIVTFEEVEGAPVGAASDPATLSDIANKINTDAASASQGNPNYGYCIGKTNDPSDITIGFLYKRADSKVTLIDCVQYGTTTLYNTPGGGTALLNDRPPFVLRANVKALNSDSGITLRVMGNHLRSLNGIDEPGIANGDRVRAKRNEQAKYAAQLLRGQVDQNANWAADDNLVVVGDYNAFDVSDGYADLVNCIAGNPAAANTLYSTSAQAAASPACTSSTPILTLLTAQNRRQYFSYSFSGYIQTLDHVLLSPKANARFSRLVYGRVNAEFSEGPTYRNDFTRPERYSDHDPAVLYLTVPVEVTSRTALNATAVALNRVTGRYTTNISVKNTSGSLSLSGPVYVFFSGLPAGVTLPDLPVVNGMPMATINLASPAAPGATSPTLTVSFANPSNTRITFTTTRFDGTY